MWLNGHVGNLRQQLVRRKKKEERGKRKEERGKRKEERGKRKDIRLGGNLGIQGANAGSWHAKSSSRVTEGAPVEIANDITVNGTFLLAPASARPFKVVSEIPNLTVPISYYKSVENAREVTAVEIGWVVKLGVARHYVS